VLKKIRSKISLGTKCSDFKRSLFASSKFWLPGLSHKNLSLKKKKKKKMHRKLKGTAFI